MSTPNLENFDTNDFLAEIRAFMKKNELTVLDFYGITGASPAIFTRLARGSDIYVRTVGGIQKTMRNYKKPTAASRP